MATTPRPVTSPLAKELFALGVLRITADGSAILLPDGTTFTPSGGTVTSADITDATATGRSVLTAANAAAARTAIGAGTSNLALGTTAGTAKAGDYAPQISDISNATAFGQAWLAVLDAAGGRASLGAGSVGASSFTANDQASGRSAIGLTPQVAVPDATDPASTMASLNLVLARLRNLGLLSP